MCTSFYLSRKNIAKDPKLLRDEDEVVRNALSLSVTEDVLVYR